MDFSQHLKIIIIAEQSPHAETLVSMINGTLGHLAQVSIVDPGNIEKLQERGSVDVCLIDLMSFDGPVVNTITELREKQPNAKIIALHIYNTPELIKPLYNVGVDGYLYHEPTKKDLTEALDKVLNGEIYVPSFFSLG